MKLVIFDLDGTLLDSREAVFLQFEKLTHEFDGAPISRELIAQAMHGTTDEITRSLVRNTTTPFEDIRRRHDELREAHNSVRSLYPGTAELLGILRRLGIQVAALTSGNHRTIQFMQDFGVHHHFHTVVAAHDVTNPKPHPEGLHLILSRLGVPAHETVMVGDTTVDILVGKNAGVAKTVGLTHGFGTHGDLTGAGADHIIHSLPELLDVIE